MPLPLRWSNPRCWLVMLVLTTPLGMVNGAARADGQFYGELSAGFGAVSHSELDFYTGYGSVTLGAFVWPNIGLEVFGDRGFRADEEGPFELSLDEAYGAAVRLQSPPANGLSGYLVLGYVDFTLEQEQAGARSVGTVAADFTGARVSIGVSRRLTRLPSLLATLEYRNYYVDEPVRFDGLVLGLRINTP